MTISTNFTVTTTATLDIDDGAIERLVEAHLRRRTGIPKEAEVRLEWRGSQCPYSVAVVVTLAATITHQRPARTFVGEEDKPDWTDRLVDAFD